MTSGRHPGRTGPVTSRENRLWGGLAIVILLWLGAVLCIDIDRPWTGSHDGVGAQWSQAARNNLRAGLATTKGVASSWHFGPLPIPPAGYYTHHPSGTPLLVTASFALFGEREWAARLVIIVSSLAGAVALWLLVLSCVGARAATFALAVLSALPMQQLFGRMVNFEAITLSWLLVGLVCLRRWDLTGRAGWLVATFVTFFAALCSGWFAYLLVGLVGLSRLTVGPKRNPRLGAALLALTVLGLLVFLVQIRLVRPDSLSELWRILLYRTSDAGHRGTGSFTFVEWLVRQGRFLGSLVLPSAWLLAVAGGLLTVRLRRSSGGVAWMGWAMLCLTAATAGFAVALLNGSWVHDFWNYYIIAPVAMGAGFAIDRLLAGWSRVMPGRLWRTAGWLVVAAGLVLVGSRGLARTMARHHYQYWILARGADEPPNLIPTLGRLLERHFPEDAHIISNLPHKGPHLRYYARRPISYDRLDAGQWQEPLRRRGERAGGLIWLGEPRAAEVVAALPPGETRTVALGPQRFLLWRPASEVRESDTAGVPEAPGRE